MAGFGVKVKLNVDKSGAAKKEFKAQIVEIASKIKGVQVKAKLTIDSASIGELAKQVKSGAESKLEASPIKIKKIDCSEAVKNLQKDLQNVINSLSIKNGVSISGLVDPSGAGEMSTKIDDVADALSNAKAKSDQFTGELQVLKSTMGALDKAYKNVNKSSSHWTNIGGVSDIANDYAALQQKVDAVNREYKEGIEVDSKYVASLRDEAIALQAKITLFNDLVAGMEAAAAAEHKAKEAAANDNNDTMFVAGSKKEADAIRRTQELLMRVQKARENWTKARRGSTATDYHALAQYELQLTSLLDALKNNRITVDQFESSLAKVNSDFKGSEKNIRDAGKAAKSFIDKFGGLAEKFSSWLSVQQLVMHLYNGFRKLVTVVIEIDTAMTELRKVTNETEAAYDSFLAGASGRAKELGTTITDIVNATADFARLGYNLEQASQLADAAVVYKNVGDGIENIDDSSSSIISTMKAFNVEAENSMMIVDKFNEVGNNFAISSKGIGDALLRSASALAAGNNTLDESIALVTAANSTIQDTDRVGTTMKTVSMFLRAAKTEAEEAGESTEGMADSVSKLRDEILALTGQRVDIQIDEDTFKSTYQIMKELSEVWDDLSDISQANILEMIGGKRNSNVVMSLIENFSVAEEVLASAAGAAGSALEENEKYLESIRGHVAEFKVAFEDFGLTFLESDVVKAVVDIGTGLFNILDALADINMFLPFIFTTVSAIVQLRKTSEKLSVGSDLAKQAIMNKVTTDELKKSYEQLTEAQKANFILTVKLSGAIDGLTKEEQEAIFKNIGLIASEKGLEGQNYRVATSFKAITASIPVWGWISMGISVLIGVITAVSSAAEKARERINELNDEIKDLTTNATNAASTLKSTTNSVDKILPRLTELSQGVNELGENVGGLTDEEYAEFWELNNELAKLFPEIDLGLDSNGNHMLALSYDADTLTSSIKGLIEQQRLLANQEISTNMGDLLDNIHEVNGESYRELYDLQQKLEYQMQLKQQIEDLYNDGNISEDAYIENLQSIESAIAGINHQIGSQRAAIDATWQKIAPTVSAWVQTSSEYINMSDEMQVITAKLVGALDYSELGLGNEDAIQQYITDTFLTPIASAKPEIQNAMVGLFDIKAAFDSGDITAGDYQEIMDIGYGFLEQAGIDEELILNLKMSLGYEDFESQINTLKANLTADLSDEDITRIAATLDMDISEATEKFASVESYMDSLSANELQLAYEIYKKDGSMSIDELAEKILYLRYQNSDTVDILDFTDFAKGINDTIDSVDKLSSAMDKLAKGTALSKKELLGLIEQYPELLEQENLFAEGGVTAQQNAINAIIDMKEQAFKDDIDRQIDELEASMEVIEKQLEVEAEKEAILLELEQMRLGESDEQNRLFAEKMAEYIDLTNIEYLDGETGKVEVNHEALNDMLEQEQDAADSASVNIWNPLGEVITGSQEKGLQGAIDATNDYTKETSRGLFAWIREFGPKFAEAIRKVLSGELKFGDIRDYVFGSDIDKDKIDGGYVSVDFSGRDPTINGQDIESWASKHRDSWTSKNREILGLRLEEINSFKQRTQNAIDNLKALRNFEFKDVISSSDGADSSSSSVKNVEEYIAVIDEFCDALKRLEEIQRRRASLEKEIDHTDDLAEKIKKSKDLIKLLREEADAERDLIDAKQATIAANVSALRGLGFDVVYDPTNNELYIKNLEHINSLTATSVGKYESLEEATNALRKETEDLIETTEKLNDDNIEAAESIEDLGYQVEDTKHEIIDYVEEIYEKQSDAYRKIIDLRKELIESAKDELDYEDEIAEKVKEIAELQTRIDQLALDDSREAQAERAALEQELAELQKDLANTQRDHSTDAQLEALDKMADDYEQERADEIELMRVTVSKSTELWDAFYDTILGKNVTVGDSVDEHVANAWIRAAQAVNEYSSAMNGISTGGVIVNPIPKYHTGGVVGESNVGKNEVLALLEEGEVVLDDVKKNSLYRIVDFQQELKKRFGDMATSFSTPDLPNYIRTIPMSAPEAVAYNQSLVFEPHISVEINHSGSMTQSDANNYGERIADVTIDKLYSAFERRGINSTRAARLKP